MRRWYTLLTLLYTEAPSSFDSGDDDDNRPIFSTISIRTCCWSIDDGGRLILEPHTEQVDVINEDPSSLLFVVGWRFILVHKYWRRWFKVIRLLDEVINDGVQNTNRFTSNQSRISKVTIAQSYCTIAATWCPAWASRWRMIFSSSDSWTTSHHWQAFIWSARSNVGDSLPQVSNCNN